VVKIIREKEERLPHDVFSHPEPGPDSRRRLDATGRSLEPAAPSAQGWPAALPDRIVIEAGRPALGFWRDLWRYRDLFYFLAWRDILVRYKQTYLGIAWALLQPALAMVVFTVVFGRLAGLPSGDTPYAVMVYAALLPWQFFSSALSQAANSLVSNAGLVAKVYFPRLIVPGSAIVACLVDFFLSLLFLFGLMAWFGVWPDWRIFALPAFLALAVGAALGAGLWLTALNVKYRDFRHAVPFALQAGLFISPVGFSSEVVPDTWRLAYSINPLVGVIDGFRWCLLGGRAELHLPGLALSVALVASLLISGLWYFRRTERAFADVI
jgi:lipopolysaccharide transport system permease protein